MNLTVTPALAATLAAVARAMEPARAPWWIIGSASVALHGGATRVADVDVVVGEADVAALLLRLALAPVTPRPDPLFRSRCFARWMAPPLPVEIMSGFCIAAAEGWTPVRLRSREAVVVGAATVFIPERAELVAILERFGRPKDRTRAALLQRRR